jgi:hypothetical protein
VAPGLTWTLIAPVASTLETLQSTLYWTFDISYGSISCVEIWTYYVAYFFLYFYTRFMTSLRKLQPSSYCWTRHYVICNGYVL